MKTPDNFIIRPPEYYPGKLMEEWQESTVQRWESERRSRPTATELENWERTVSEIRTRYKLAEDRKDRAELCHRLAMAYVKMEDYSQARSWVDIGLAEGPEEWVRELQEDLALILYLQDRKEEALAILDELSPRPLWSPRPSRPSGSRPGPRRPSSCSYARTATPMCPTAS